MGVVAGDWSMLYDPYADPPPGLSHEQHARAQVTSFDVTLPRLRGVPGLLRLELIRVADTPPPSDASSDDDTPDEPSHTHVHEEANASLTQHLAALKRIYD
jgi:hypothetical protein